ncbi:hypothetical protein Mterra_03844 [Calidithermus terrae]|uniref:DUF2785 domain-containing protein n=1 Tax=Calidithermus terrae TaxID=1408545 RepID=A0A399DWW4_9DEIN|nr:DUF2785 domain-containing protein [Calidithermus terrae]RIH76714.1 hypothetical protein Mterra_03844 [Calidithermus terrae]
MRRVWMVFTVTALGFGSLALGQQATCIGGSMDRLFWLGIKNSGYAVPQGQSADALSHNLLACLASPDPELRDGFGYAILTRWFRAGQVSNPALKGIAARLTQNLKAGVGEQGTDTVFGRSFSALILSEVVRRDVQAPFLEPAEFRAVLEAGLAYLGAERDLRGYDARQGYIHGVAHGADLLWRLASSPKTDKADLERILQAVAGKVAPEGEHSYVHGESDRLARVALYALNRGLLEAAWVQEWVKQLARPGRLGQWSNAFGSTAGLAQLHNTQQFLRALESFLRLAKPKGADELLPTLMESINSLILF